jgi:hypothetical protein
MKIKPAHFDELSKQIEKTLRNRSYRYLLKRYREEGYGQDPERCLCFAIFYQAPLDWRISFTDKVYEYANDANLFTAIRRACQATA